MQSSYLKLALCLFALNLNSFVFSQTWPTLNLFTQSNPNNHIEITGGLAGTPYSASRPTKILIHGFGDSLPTTKLRAVKDEILAHENVNVFIVDWRIGALSPDYISAAANSKVTGDKVAAFITNNGINPKNVHCIGHSLGAHACGFAGKITKLQRISGLDPAGPLFKGNAPSGRLDKGDADFVDNIHVDAFFGIQDAIGHKDFYPNGGKSQVGCGLGKTEETEIISVNFLSDRADITDLLACSHVRVPFYFSESVRSACKFTSVPCDSYEKFTAGQCSCNSQFGCSSMGYAADKTKEEGKFYLDTNRVAPWCKS